MASAICGLLGRHAASDIGHNPSSILSLLSVTVTPEVTHEAAVSLLLAAPVYTAW